MTQDENNLGYRGASAARTARACAPSLPSTRATRSQVLNHEGWRNGSKQTTLVAILGAAGSDCTDDMLEVHSEAALRQLAGFQIGVLDVPNPCRPRRARFKTWDELVEMGRV